jgi:carbon storage regulator
MLVLTRKRDEQIILNLPEQTIRIRVVAVEGNRVRIGIEAPRDVHITREELVPEAQV